MRAYATLVERRRKAFDLAIDTTAYAVHLKVLRDSLAGIAKLRGRHAHEEPFSDEQIGDIGIFVTMSTLIGYPPLDVKWKCEVVDGEAPTVYADAKEADRRRRDGED